MEIDLFFQTYGELLQYIVFFGVLILMGVLEVIGSQRKEAPRRLGRWPTNFGLTVLNIVILGALPLSGIAIADFAREQGLGILNKASLSFPAVLAVAILIRSFVSYATHIAMHRIPIFWTVHRVHHTDSFIDISTTVRFHPLEFIIQIIPNIGVILVFGLQPWTLIIYEMLDAVMNIFIHANVRLPKTIDRYLRVILITPNMHRVHHSTKQSETNSNYGVVLSFWDILFRTYKSDSELGQKGMRIGLEEFQSESVDSFGWLLVLPFQGKPLSKTQVMTNQQDEST